MAEWLLRVALEGDVEQARFVVADLVAERRELAARRSGLLAWCWFWQELVRVGVRIRLARWKSVRRVGPAVGWRKDRVGMEWSHAVRFLRRRPGFSAAVILTVMLSIAAVTLAFAVVDGVLVEPLPWRSPERLVVVWEVSTVRSRDRNVVSPANYLTWRERARSFASLGALVELSGTVRAGGDPERVGAVLATASVFEVLGATPLVGRLYDASDDVPGAERVVVLGEAYWRRRFGADPAVIGHTIELNGEAVTIVGVLPSRQDFEAAAKFQSMGTRDVWEAPRWGAAARQAGGRFLQVIGRLNRGVTVEGAQREMSELAAGLRDEFPARQAGWDVNVLPLREQIVGDVRPMLLVVFGAVCLVLLIACANVANLLVTRAIEREQELAVRSALGAGRGRLMRQLLLESAILAGAGGLLGLVLANAGLRLLVAAGPGIPRLDSVGLNPRIAGFAFLATSATALFFGLLPAFHVLAGDTGGWLRERTGAVRREARRLRSVLVVVQTALSLMLLIGAGLLVRSLIARFDVGVGFDTHRLLTAEVELIGPAYDDEARRAAFFEDLVERAQALPGVERAGAITFPPLAGAGSATSFWLADRPLPPEGERPVADVRWVQRDYFATLGIPLLEGRVFDRTDDASAPLRIVINRTAAETLWAGEDPIGREILMPWGDTLRAQVIGVVGDVRHNGPETELRPMFYWEHRQFQDWRQMTMVLRTTGEPVAVVPALRALVRDADPSLPVYNVHSMDELFGDSVARARLATVSLTVFALLALLLAAIGLYGVIAHATRQREREIGIRMALGANTGGVLRMVLTQGMRLVLVALVLGAVGAFALTRLLRGLVFGVTTTDPLTFAAMICVLAAAALAACFIPARRAAAIQPVDAIRTE